MTQSNHNTTVNYQQLSAEERGQIQAYFENGYSLRSIAKRLHRIPSTISRELKRGTIRQLNSDYLLYFKYFAEAGQAIYEKHHLNCHSKEFLKRCWLFFKMLCKAFKEHFRVDSVDSSSIVFNVIIQMTHVPQRPPFIATLI